MFTMKKWANGVKATVKAMMKATENLSCYFHKLGVTKHQQK